MKTLAVIQNDLFKDYLRLVSTNDLPSILDNPDIPVPFNCLTSVDNANSDLLLSQLQNYFSQSKIKNKDFYAFDKDSENQLHFMINLIKLSSGETVSSDTESSIKEPIVEQPKIEKLVSEKEQNKIYQKGIAIKVDNALEKLNITLEDKSTWWKVVDILFKNNMIIESRIAQQHAVPVVAHFIEQPKIEEVIEPVAEQPKVETVVEPVIEQPKVEEVVEPVVEQPKVEEVVAPVIEEPRVEEVVAPVIEEPRVEEDNPFENSETEKTKHVVTNTVKHALSIPQEKVVEEIEDKENISQLKIIESLGIPEGATITFIKDPNITAILLGEKNASYENQTMTLAEAAKAAFKKSGTVGMAVGLSNWNYQDETLKAWKEKKIN